MRCALCALVAVWALVIGSGAQQMMPEDSDSNAALDEGRRRYNELRADAASSPRFGPCWTEALAQLETGCKRLTDDEQAHLALQFANCFLAKTGQPTHPCKRNQEVAECLQGASTNAFGAYTNFFTVSQNKLAIM